MSRTLRNPEWFDRGLPAWRPTPPPLPLWRARASAWCGADDHPRVIIERRRERQLEAAVTAWRCPRCGRASL